MSPNAFFFYTVVSSAFFGLAIFWVIVSWLRADERARDAEAALRATNLPPAGDATDGDAGRKTA